MADDLVPVFDPWDQQPDEDPKAHAAFQCYLALPIRERSLRAAFRKYSGQSNANYVPANFLEWSQRFGWENRAQEFDRARNHELYAQRLDEARRLEALRIKAYTNMVAIGLTLMSKAELDSTEDDKALTAHEARDLLKTAIWAVSDGSRGLRKEHEKILEDDKLQPGEEEASIMIYIPDNQRGDR